MKILFISLGCDKNLVDTEMMLGQLSEEGFTFTDDETQAEVIVVNTCCFINDAKEESINTILERGRSAWRRTTHGKKDWRQRWICSLSMDTKQPVSRSSPMQ